MSGCFEGSKKVPQRWGRFLTSGKERKRLRETDRRRERDQHEQNPRGRKRGLLRRQPLTSTAQKLGQHLCKIPGILILQAWVLP